MAESAAALPLQRKTPSDTDHERRVLGGVFLAGRVGWTAVAEILQRDDFHLPQHRYIVDAILSLYRKEHAVIDEYTVRKELERIGRLEEVGAAYVDRLVDGMPRSNNLEGYAQLVKRDADRRAIHVQLQRVWDDVYDSEDPQALMRGFAESALAQAGGIDRTAVLSRVGRTSEWPQPMSSAVNVGIFGEIVSAIAPETEADSTGLLLQLLSMFGSVIGRTAHFRVGADVHYLNLFVALIGLSGKGRKGVSTGQAIQLFSPVDPAWIDRRISGLSSGEGLIYQVRDKLERKQAVKEHGRVVDYQVVIEDHGVDDKRLYVDESEFARVLKTVQREGNILSAVIREAWDGKKLRTTTKSTPLTATDPHISITASITAGEVRREFATNEIENGFANRFLWVCVKRSQFLPDGGADVPLGHFVERLRELVERARGIGRIERDGQARDLWHATYRELSAGRPGVLGSITARAEAHVMRLACLYALGDGQLFVGVAHLRAALETWRYCFDSAAHIFGDALGEPRADALLAALKEAGARGVTRTEITRDVFGGNVQSLEVNRLLGFLQDADLANCIQSAPEAAGRPAERWFHKARTYEQNEPNASSFVSFVGSEAQRAVVVPMTSKKAWGKVQ